MTQVGRICPRGAELYTWKTGDTLAGVARSRGISVQTLQSANPDLNFSTLATGDLVCLPAAVASCGTGRSYVIKRGDTLYSLARKYGTTVQQIQQLNPTLKPNSLVIGETICLPAQGTVTPPSTSGCGAGYTQKTVAAGQNYTDLLINNNLSYNTMQCVNPSIKPTQVTTGQKYCVPQVGACNTGKDPYQIGETMTFAELAAKLNTTQGELLRLNPTLRPTDFTVGQFICVP